MGDRLGLPCLGTPGAVDFLANPQLPSVASMANPLGGPGRGSSLGSETHYVDSIHITHLSLRWVGVLSGSVNFDLLLVPSSDQNQAFTPLIIFLGNIFSGTG